MRAAPGDWLLWGAAGLALVVFSGLVARLSKHFAYDNPGALRWIPTFVVLLMAAGFVYAATMWFGRRTRATARLIVWVVAVGLIARGVMFSTEPILEDDHYRYLWDGGVTAHRFNPYGYSPAKILKPGETTRVPPRRLRELADESGVVAGRVNHP